MLKKCNFKGRTYHAFERKGHLAGGCCSSKRAPAMTHKPLSKDPPRQHSTHSTEQLEPCLIEDKASSDRSTPSTLEDYPMFTLPGKTRPLVQFK